MMKQIYSSSFIACAFFCLLGFTSASAQRRVVTGKIADGTGQSLPGVSVLIKGTTQGTATDVDGAFSIEAGAEDILVLSFIGYLTEEVKVGNQTSINFTMVEDIATLQEIVVIGYGSQKTRDLSSAQVTIGEDDIKKTVNTTLDQALQGRAANVFVASNSGKPGGASSIYIRGVSSVNGNVQPMYVIDGVQIVPPNNTDIAGQSNILSSINPDDIETMNVLSGPQAQSIYGSKASNGVIVVTTKKGKAGQSKINFTSQYNIQSLPKQLPVMNLREYAIYSNAWADDQQYGRKAEFSDPSILGEGTNWQTALFKTAIMKKQNLSISGGTDKTTYYLSGELMNQDGLAPNSGFNRKSIRLNIGNQLKSYLKIGTNLSVSGTSEKLSIGADDIIKTAIKQPPSTPLTNGDGSWGGPQNVTPTSSSGYVTNPVALAYTNSNEYKRITTFGGVFADATVLKNFVVHVDFNGNFGNDTRAEFKPSYQFGRNNITLGASNPLSESRRYANNNNYWISAQQLTYAKKINKHDITVAVGHEAQKNFNEALSGLVTGYTSNGIPELSAGDTKTSISASSRDASSQESYFGRVGYVYNDKYILNATYRGDGSSNFGPNNRWGYFPSASLAWRVSGEPFMEGMSSVNELKLRAEVGTTGSQFYGKPTYASMNAVSTQTGQGYLVANFENPNLKWETTKAYGVGLNFSGFQNRVTITFDAYLRRTDNLITNLPLPAYGGTTGNGSVGPPTVNLGNLENKGLGLTVNLTPIQGQGGLKWNTNFNISLDRNKLIKLSTERAIVDVDPWFTDVTSRSSAGQPLWQFYAYKYDGIFKTYQEVVNSAIPVDNSVSLPVNKDNVWVGDVKFKDLNNDGLIDDRDRGLIGNPWPKFTFGFTNDFYYKNFQLTVFMQGVYGNKVFNQLRLENSGFSNEIRGAYKEAVTFARPTSYSYNQAIDDVMPTLSNPETNVPRVGNTPNANGRATDKFIEDGSYLRVKNISLSYKLSKSFLKKYLPVEGLRLAAGIQNAYTWTHYSGYDPEVGNSWTGVGNIPGFDNGRYPSSKMYNFSISVDF